MKSIGILPVKTLELPAPNQQLNFSYVQILKAVISKLFAFPPSSPLPLLSVASCLLTTRIRSTTEGFKET